jgi:cytosine/adenosine deaminase-related metal-dependent hydrolase
MKILSYILSGTLLLACSSQSVRTPANQDHSESFLYIGKIPGLYLGKEESKTFLGFILTEGRVIKDIGEDYKSAKSTHAKLKQVEFKNAKSGKWDIIYPGLIDLHGHNKQNMLPTWEGAKGRFSSRYEWRDKDKVPSYKYVQAGHMNPWSRSGSEAEMAAYRWSELQAMVHGTVLLQGHTMHDQNFAIHSVESEHSYISDLPPITGPGDVIDPLASKLLWMEIKPRIEKMNCLGEEDCYGRAMSDFLSTHCKEIEDAYISDIYNRKNAEAMLEAADEVIAKCTYSDPKSFKKWLGQHAEVIKRIESLKTGKNSHIITHIGEGKRLDPLSALEYKILRLTGLARKGMHLIHAVSSDESDYKHMAQNEIGVVWSPSSNIILYGETLDLEKIAMMEEKEKINLTMSLGSDWTPTGTKGVIDELKLAKKYVVKNKLTKSFSDKRLYEMVTSIPAKMIGRYGKNNKDAGYGTLEKGAMAAFIVTSDLSTNPYTNLVEQVTAKDINVVVIDGKIIYGDEAYVTQVNKEFEKISETAIELDDTVTAPKFGATMIEVAAVAKDYPLKKVKGCGHQDQKVFVQTHSQNEIADAFLTTTEVNLDSYDGILRILGLNLFTQSQNSQEERGMTKMPPLYGCDDKTYEKFLNDFIKIEGSDKADSFLKFKKANRKSNEENIKLFPPMAMNFAKELGLPLTEIKTAVEGLGNTVVDVSLDSESPQYVKYFEVFQ